MRRPSIVIRPFFLVLAALAAWPATAQTDSQAVTVVVPLARVFDVDDTDVTLAFASPVRGAFAPVTATSSYDISVSNAAVSGLPGDYKITVHSTAAYPGGVTLTALLDRPSNGANGGASTGAQVVPVGALNAVAVVTGIRKVNGRGRRITYTATAALTALPGAHTRTVVYTLVQE